MYMYMYIEKMKTRLSINSENSKRFSRLLEYYYRILLNVKLIYSTLDCKSLSGFENNY